MPESPIRGSIFHHPAARACVCVIAAASMPRAYAQASKVTEIAIRGNSHISADTITAVLRSKVGEEFSETVMNADDFVQGLKRHWFLRSAFRSETNVTHSAPVPVPSPKHRGQ